MTALPARPVEPPPEIAALLRSVAGPERGGNGASVSVLLAGLGGLLVMLPYLPFGLAVIENLTFGTGHVEALCRDLEIHDELLSLYRATFPWLR